MERAACNNLAVGGGLGPRACCLRVVVGHGTQGQRLCQFQFITQPVPSKGVSQAVAAIYLESPSPILSASSAVVL